MATLVDIRHNLPSPLSSVSVTEEITSIDPTNLDGGVGTVTAGLNGMDNPLDLWDRDYWVKAVRGGDIINFNPVTVNWDAETVSVSGETILTLLNVTRTFRPEYSAATLYEQMRRIFLTCGLDMVSTYTITGLPTIPTPDTFRFPGYHGTGWEYVKMFCIVNGYELTINDKTFQFRAIRTAGTIPTGYLTARSFTIDKTQSANEVNLVRYNILPVPEDYPYDNMEFTPFNNPDAQILTVNAGETITYQIQTNAWIESVNQPTPYDFVGPYERFDGGAYCVVGGDGFPLTAAEWILQGGGVSVALNPDSPSVIDVTLTGANNPDIGPFSLAADPGDTTYANSLHITGHGIRYTIETLTIPTGATSQDSAVVTVDNPFVQSLDQAYSVGCTAAGFVAGPIYRGTVDFQDQNYYDLFTVVGRRFKYADTFFRILSATWTEAGFSVACIMDTTMDDFNSTWPTETFTQFNSQWPTQTFSQFSVKGLKRG